MGRIKQLMVKRAAHDLRKLDLDFSPSFDQNKKLLKNSMPSKKIRNKIAGYIARLEKAKAN